MPINNQYHPDHPSPPGDTLIETLNYMGITLSDLACKTGLDLRTLQGIAKGSEAITPQIADMFEASLGIPARFWLARERNYRDALRRSQDSQQS